MFQDKSVGVVVPCHNEAALIGSVIETMPSYVDRIYVVDDVSSDDTVSIVKRYVAADPERVTLIRHPQNRGVGAAIVTGYKAAVDENVDLVAVMAGDAQMDPDDLEALLEPVASGQCDYAKGNRLFSGDAWTLIPRVRYLGNSALSLMTKVASGYWHVADSQTGYTVASLKALQTIELDSLYPRYGFPNDILVRLNVFGFRVHDVPVRPVYGVGEKSGIRLLRVIPAISFLLFRRFWFRMFQKYVIHDTHPLVLFYMMGNAFVFVGVWLGLLQVFARLRDIPPSVATTVLATLLLISGLQFIFFAMWFDMDYNKEMR
ncbi:MAG: glycosyltransferase family 2 protein [Actinobacteria bacterium]|nr:glycosyltransferase family 2 protein [Actinomycetota bacterium]MCG2807162.1 glycosyltransferase family 2 protein [Coriobacteriia bacterium]